MRKHHLIRLAKVEATNLRPSRLDTIKRLRFGLLVNLGGLLLALLAAETITGNLFAKALQVQPNPLNIAAIDTNKLIQPLDIFVVLGNTQGIEMLSLPPEKTYHYGKSKGDASVIIFNLEKTRAAFHDFIAGEPAAQEQTEEKK